MDFELYRKLVASPIALVTGANKGIGLEIARKLATGGIFVWMAGRDEQRVSKAANELKGQGLKVEAVALDVTDPSSCVAAASRVKEQSGRLDILVNNAGIALESRMKGKQPEIIPPSEVELSMLRETYETNVFGPFNVTKTFLPLLRESKAGRIVNMSSGLGSLTQRSEPGSPYARYNAMAYCSSKSALNGITVAFANELEAEGIKANAADPGYCATDLNGHSGPRSSSQGADIAVHLATLGADGPTRGYFDDEGAVPW